ncbi:hypothetical protein M5K25_024666 [Dendrobium thyrsiflorum]|uniref:Uncharacterized protein n=1 Tax=Dendrobium thyrsiflorum TaxID=117978 RepID=A0ABD0U2Q1_DENTH
MTEREEEYVYKRRRANASKFSLPKTTAAAPASRLPASASRNLLLCLLTEKRWVMYPGRGSDTNPKETMRISRNLEHGANQTTSYRKTDSVVTSETSKPKPSHLTLRTSAHMKLIPCLSSSRPSPVAPSNHSSRSTAKHFKQQQSAIFYLPQLAALLLVPTVQLSGETTSSRLNNSSRRDLFYSHGFIEHPDDCRVKCRSQLEGKLAANPKLPSFCVNKSLHHLNSVDPLHPDKSHSEALRHLLKEILQQTVCYDRKDFRTISVFFLGFAVQPRKGHFRPWERDRSATSGIYMFDTRKFPRDLCKRQAISFLESLYSSVSRTESNYIRHTKNTVSARRLRQITVSSEKSHLQIGKAPRRRYCDVIDSCHEAVMNVNIRKCKDDELIACICWPLNKEPRTRPQPLR